MKKRLLCVIICVVICVCSIGCNNIFSPTPSQEKTELSLRMSEDGTLRIAQFADFHFGTEGEQYHNGDEARTLQFMDHIVTTTNPDFIVLTGDNIMCTGIDGIKELISWMDQYETPWTIIWGNHDTIAGSWGYSKKDLSNYLTRCDSKYLIYQEDYVETGSEDRYGNFAVSVLDSTGEKLLGAILLMDSGTYDYSIEGYQSITEGQIDWYKNKITSLQSVYVQQSQNACEMVPSIIFAHIPLPEHAEGYEKALNDDGAEFVIYQEVNSRFISAVKNSGPLVDTNFFDTLKDVGSTRAYFVGHMHSLRFQVKMDGILLGFGPQTGFAKMGSASASKKVSYVYEIGEGFEVKTVECWEE